MPPAIEVKNLITVYLYIAIIVNYQCAPEMRWNQIMKVDNQYQKITQTVIAITGNLDNE